MKKIISIFCLFLVLLFSQNTEAQLGLKKKKSKNKFECGYIHKKTLKERLNVGAVAGKVLGGFFKKGAHKFDFSTTSVTLGRANHIYPQGFVDASFKWPGWEVCGTNFGAFAMDKLGIPMIEIPSFTIDNKPYEPVVFGQYFQAFPHQDISEKVVEIKDNNGKSVKVALKPMEGFKIKSVNGVPRWDASLKYDGEEDLVIELENKVDPTMKIGVELHNKISGVRFNSPVFYCEDKETIIIPKEAFRNSLKFIEDNMLIVYKIKETLLDDQTVGYGALRVLNQYYDFTPITITGKMQKSFLIKAWKKENKKVEQKDLSKITKYDFEFKKGDPLYFYPSSAIKKIAIPSFVVRGNLKHQHIDVETQSSTSVSYTRTHKITTTMTTKTTRTFTKWFPQLNKDTWKNLADRLYTDFEASLKEKYNVPVVDVNQIVKAKSYQNIVPILDTVTKNFVEVGAFNTQRVLPSIKYEKAAVQTTGNKSADQAKQPAAKGISTEVKFNTFPSDFITSRVMKEFGANCAITVNFDLEFDIAAEALLPVVSIRFYAPTKGVLSQMAYYHEVHAYFKESISLKEASKLSGSAVDQIYGMIDAPRFFSELKYTIDQILETEKENPVYQTMWDAMN